MSDELHPTSSRPEDGPREEPWEETPLDFEADAEPNVGDEPPTTSPPIYGRPPERHLGREIPVWALGAAALVLVAIVALVISLIGGGEEAPPSTPTPDATALARQATLEAMAATPTPVPPTPTPTPTPEPVLRPGGMAVVTGSNPEGVRLRAGPGLGNATLDVLYDGTVFEILPQPGNVSEYPVEVDGYTWWRVRTEDGLVGWVAGDWLAPLPPGATPPPPVATPTPSS